MAFPWPGFAFRGSSESILGRPNTTRKLLTERFKLEAAARPARPTTRYLPLWLPGARTGRRANTPHCIYCVWISHMTDQIATVDIRSTCSSPGTAGYGTPHNKRQTLSRSVLTHDACYDREVHPFFSSILHLTLRGKYMSFLTQKLIWKKIEVRGRMQNSIWSRYKTKIKHKTITYFSTTLG